MPNCIWTREAEAYIFINTSCDHHLDLFDNLVLDDLIESNIQFYCPFCGKEVIIDQEDK